MCRRTTEEITHPPVEPQQSEPIPRICVQESPRLSENHDGHPHTERRQGRRGRTKFFPKGQSPLLSAYKHPVSAHTRPSFDRKHSAHCGNQGDGLALETKSTLSQVLNCDTVACFSKNDAISIDRQLVASYARSCLNTVALNGDEIL